MGQLGCLNRYVWTGHLDARAGKSGWVDLAAGVDTSGLVDLAAEPILLDGLTVAGADMSGQVDLATGAKVFKG